MAAPVQFTSPGNNAFSGGARIPSATPTEIGAGGFSSPAAAASTPTGVAAPSIAFARNDRGSNVTVPYARLVPMKGASVNKDESLVTMGERIESEYSELSDGELAYVLGKHKLLGASSGHEGARTERLMDVGRGVNRAQRLASQRYMEAFIMNRSLDANNQVVTIALDTRLTDPSVTQHSSMMEEVTALVAGATLIDSRGYEGRGPAAGSLPGGINVAEFGPFLRGKNFRRTGLQTVKSAHRDSLAIEVAENISDTFAFDALVALLCGRGLMAWRPDGIVMSSLQSPSGDFYGSAQLDAASGQLFNVAIQGPALCKTWAGLPYEHPLPQDRVFILMIADVLSWRGAEPTAALRDWKDGVAAFHKARVSTASVSNDPSGRAAAAESSTWLKFEENIALLRAAAAESKKSNSGGTSNALMGNFKLMRATSAMLLNHSGPKGAKKRLGLRHGVHNSGAVLAEFVVGGWCIGNIIDSKASPAARASGVRAAPGSMGLNVNVCVEWLSGDELFARYQDTAQLDGQPLYP